MPPSTCDRAREGPLLSLGCIASGMKKVIEKGRREKRVFLFSRFPVWLQPSIAKSKRAKRARIFFFFIMRTRHDPNFCLEVSQLLAPPETPFFPHPSFCLRRRVKSTRHHLVWPKRGSDCLAAAALFAAADTTPIPRGKIAEKAARGRDTQKSKHFGLDGKKKKGRLVCVEILALSLRGRKLRTLYNTPPARG